MTTEQPARPRSRRGDYMTATQRGRDAARRAPNQKVKLLIQYRVDVEVGGDGLTDEEIGTAAGLLATYYWKRCGELRADGLVEQEIEPDRSPRMRKGSAGVPRMVCSITAAGLAYLEAMDL